MGYDLVYLRVECWVVSTDKMALKMVVYLAQSKVVLTVDLMGLWTVDLMEKKVWLKVELLVELSDQLMENG